jgi:hypothetical protein
MINMKKISFVRLSYLMILLVFFLLGCEEHDPLPLETKPPISLSKEAKLDSIMRSNNSLEFAMMIDSKVVTGQNGWYSADTIVFGANDPNRNGPYRTFVSRMIGDFEPFSKEKNKYALYTPVERFITIKAADSVSKFGVNSGDTALVLFLHQYQRVSHALPELDNTALDDFISAFPHKGTNEKSVCDSFLTNHHPRIGNWGGSYITHKFQTSRYQNLFQNPSDNSVIQWISQDYDPAFYAYVFKAGSLTADQIKGFGIYFDELLDDQLNEMEIKNQKLTDGLEHHVMYVKIPYTMILGETRVTRFIRARYVLD